MDALSVSEELVTVRPMRQRCSEYEYDTETSFDRCCNFRPNVREGAGCRSVISQNYKGVMMPPACLMRCKMDSEPNEMQDGL